MMPPQTQPPSAKPFTDPRSGAIDYSWVQWFQYYFKIDPSWQIILKKSGPYTMLYTDEVLIVDTSGGGVTITLPSTLGQVWDSALNRSKVYTIKAQGANAVTVNGNGQNIDGAATATIAANTSKRLVNDGSVWYTL